MGTDIPSYMYALYLVFFFNNCYDALCKIVCTSLPKCFMKMNIVSDLGVFLLPTTDLALMTGGTPESLVLCWCE